MTYLRQTAFDPTIQLKIGSISIHHGLENTCDSTIVLNLESHALDFISFFFSFLKQYWGLK
jgi:hypothetical protein